MVGTKDTQDEKYLIAGIRTSDRKAFEKLFDIYYVDLVMFCGKYISDWETCRDIVSSIYMTLWDNGPGIRIERSLKSYLLNMVRNRALNEIRHHKVIQTHITAIASEGADILASDDTDNYVLYTEMRARIDTTISQMPDKIRQTYISFMEEGMKSRDIALAENVTQRTIELRINKALEILRKSLAVIAIIIAIN